jgi:hypothetical protein
MMCRWRGYWSRKTKFDYYERKEYVRSIAEKVKFWVVLLKIVDARNTRETGEIRDPTT